METVKEDISVLSDFVQKKDGNKMSFSKYSSIFLFTTENQEAINDVVSYKGKDVLSVASSADQYVSALYYDANKVDLFDINKFTYYMSYLKVSAIAKLSYQEFLEFMIPLKDGKVSELFWNLRTLKKLDNLPLDVMYFWENAFYLFKKFGYGNFLYPQHKHSLKENVLCGMPFYGNEEEYYKLQKILISKDFPKFILSDIINLSGKESYDLIYLSNIIECMVCEEINGYAYFYGVNENSIEVDKVRISIGAIYGMLRKNGDILVSYRPNTNLEDSCDVLYNNDYFEPVLVPCKIKPDNSDGRRNKNTDIVLTYNPSRKGNFLG